MSVLENKNIIQRNALNSWVKDGCRGTIEAATAFGKTRVGILAIAYFAKKADYKFKALIVTPTTAIQEEWRKEFKKWGETRVLNECVEIYCINTAREFIGESYDIGVFDEIHNYINGEVNFKVFQHNEFKKMLGLSASIDNSIMGTLNRLAPICYALSVYDALELGLISEFTVYNLPITLTESENSEYKALSNSISYTWERFGRQAWKKIGERKDIVYKAANKLGVVREISDYFNGNYGIVFSQTKDYADMVKNNIGDTCVSHHSGITAKNRLLNLKRFADGRTKIKRISSAKTLDEGVTLPRLEFAVIASGSSKPKQMIQRVGRCLRLDVEGKHAVIIRLYVKDTVEENWISNAQKGFKVVNINSIDEINAIRKS
jgi:superfamily II DNA or RNA helicase